MKTNTMDGNTWTRTPSQPHLRQLWRLEAWLLLLPEHRLYFLFEVYFVFILLLWDACTAVVPITGAQNRHT